MAPITTVVSKTTTTEVATLAPSLLDSKQTLRATTALLRKIQADEETKKSSAEKTNLLADADEADVDDEIPIWLILTTKKHILDEKRLKPGKILLPHPYLDPTAASSLRICLITADPQRFYKDLIADPSFPPPLAQHIQRVIGLTKLKAKYKSFESRRQLLSEYDLFLADERVITQLPKTLGKVFYSRTSKRPIPVVLEGKRQPRPEADGKPRRALAAGGSKASREQPLPSACAHEIDRALRCALVHLAPSTTTAVRVGTASQTPQQVAENVGAVVAELVKRFVPRGWKNVRAVHVKGPETVALPVWLTEELWQDERDVLEEAEVRAIEEGKEERKRKRKRGPISEGEEKAEEDVLEVPGPDGKMRKVVRPAAKRKSVDGEGERVAPAPAKKRKGGVVSGDELAVKEAEKREKAARKEDLKKQKAEAKAAATANGATEKKSPAKVAAATGDAKAARKSRLKAEDLF